MKIAMIGLGRMGMNMAKRVLFGGHEVVAFNRTVDKTFLIEKEKGATGAYSLDEVVEQLKEPRIIWIMLPAGKLVDEYINQLEIRLTPGDIIVDGGNSYFRDAIKRAEFLDQKGIHYIDAGVSGGIWGLKEGYCLMIGGKKETFEYLEPIFKTLSSDEGYLYCGPSGAGHFTKMIHNGIEYGMMQSYAEGFEIMEASQYSQFMDFEKISHLWNNGSIIKSWLLELAEKAFSKDPRLSGIKGYVADSGEGRWAVHQAIETNVSAPVITMSLMNRFRSRKTDTFSDKVTAALRREFGGHPVVISENKE